MALADALNARAFRFVHGGHLVYNACWEDPRLDRVALDLGPDDTVMVVTSAGCNALDYAALGPRRVFAVDVNPRQNALLELKQAAIRALHFDEFFEMFGRGRWDGSGEAYRRRLRPQLAPGARAYWDRHIRFFSAPVGRPSFYYCGTSGIVARAMRFYIDQVARVGGAIEDLLRAGTIEQQREIYDRRLGPAIRTGLVRWIVSHDWTLSLLGVPRAQRLQVERDHPGGIARFVEDAIEAVFARLPFHDNYFWRVYLTGAYTPGCCPEYLKRETFERLRDGLVDRISTHTCSVLQFLESTDASISRFVLLDHMDWLASVAPEVLVREWQAITDAGAPGARVIWRSGGLGTDFVDGIEVTVRGRRAGVGDILTYHRALAARLHAIDRVHTYGSFQIADMITA